MNQTLKFWSCTFHKNYKFSNNINFYLSNFILYKRNASLVQYNEEINKSPLWITNLPSKRKRAVILNERKKLKKNKNCVFPGPVSIECKRSEFNHYRSKQYSKFESIPLASKGWHHKKSYGDHFTILKHSKHPAFLNNAKEKINDTFETTGLSSTIIQELKKLQIYYPTVIQAKSIPLVLQGENVLITAETGCGKTLTYLAPIADNVLKLKNNGPGEFNSPFAVVLLPTRELAIQVGMVTQKICFHLGLNCFTLLGGKTKQLLLNPVKHVTDILVCTPGILKKMLSFNLFSMHRCMHFVLDEADTLLDDSFSSKVKYIFNKTEVKFIKASEGNTGKQGQICLISATMPTNIDDALHNIINKHNLVEISSYFLHKIQPHVPQKFIRTSSGRKAEELLKIIRNNDNKNIPTMIFCNKTATCDWLNYFLNENGINSISVNAKMKFETRLGKYQKFRDGLINVICCTDVASRGLDSTRVKHVINYDFPKFMVDYIHRCGRTGRIGHDEDCLITSFISSPKELPLLHSIEKSARTSSTLQNVNNNIKKILNCSKFDESININ